MRGWKKKGWMTRKTEMFIWRNASSGFRKDARWKILQDNAKQESIGNLIDKAMESIEKDNPIAERDAAGQLRARHAG